MLAQTTLFTVRSKFNSILNVMLVKYLVNERGLKGVYVSLERPSYYIRKLLKARGVNMDNITFIDAISKVSGDSKVCDTPDEISAKLLENPFSREFLQNIITSETGEAVQDMDIDFMLIDSLSVLSCYVDDESLLTLLESLSEDDKISTLMSVDKTCNADLYNKARSLCQKEINLKDDLSIEPMD
jgi:KaiC/GvpD/RAD55 family RecA-like ATPase